MADNLPAFSELHEDSSFRNKPARPTITLEANMSNSIENSPECFSRMHNSISSKLRLELDKEEKSIMDISKLISKADKMNEEIRTQRNVIKSLEEENAKLLQYKEKVKQLKSECDYLAKENSKLQQEKNLNNNQIAEIEEAHQLELEKLKHSFDEMDGLLQQEKSIHKKEEQKLLNIINQLNDKLSEARIDIENKGRSERMYMEKLDELKESNKKLKESVSSYKKNEANNKTLLTKSKETIKELQLKNRELTEVIENSNLEKVQFQALIEHEKEKVLLHFTDRMKY